MKSEIHLFIIWPKAMHRADEILTDLKGRLDIIEVYVIRWSDRYFSQNLSRFYGTNLPDGSFKEKHCGKAPFCLIVGRDPSPCHDWRQTSTGLERVNVNIFDAKQVYRELTGGGHRIHATNSQQETAHDLMLLLAQNIHQFMAARPSGWDGRMKFVEKDLPGAAGWESIEQFFGVLNATIPYVVLRNFEELPLQYTLDGHGDIDLLCSSLQQMRYIANARALFEDRHRVLHEVSIGGQNVLFDFRHLGDGYYDAKWQKDILSRRVLSAKGFYRPDEKNYFFSLLYHAAVHKPFIKKDYIDRLCSLSGGLIDLTADTFNDPARIKAIIADFFSENDYRHTEPVDLSVHFNPTFVGGVKLSLDRIFDTSQSIGGALLRLMNQTENCATDSPEFASLPFRSNELLRRHFSSHRYAWLDSLPLKKSAHVLEVGAKTGLITRYLGENFASVVAVEEDTELAQVAAARCRDLPSVSIRAIELENFESTGRFDMIVIACDCDSLATKGATLSTIASMLRKMIRRLAPGGVFVLTIDNPLSKAGVHGSGPSLACGSDAAVDPVPSLLGKDLIKLINAEGLRAHQLCYLFPDHILPEVLFSEEAVKRNLRAFGYWAAKVHYNCGEYDNNLIQAGEISLAGNLGDLSGGICIMATHDAVDLPDLPWQVLSFSNELRPPITQTITKIKSGDDLTVTKQGRPLKSALFEFNPLLKNPLNEGYLVDAVIDSCVTSGNLNRLMAVLDQIIDFLLSRFKWEPENSSLPPLTTSGDCDLRGAALDAISRNLILKDGKLHVFDLEWSSLVPLPLSYVLYRSISCLQDFIDPQEMVGKLKFDKIDSGRSFEHVIVRLINQTKRFSPLNDTHGMIFRQFDRRFKTFAFTAQLPQDTPSLLELYQRAKVYFSSNDAANLTDSLDRLETHYPHHPSVMRLRSYLNERELCMI